MLDVLLVLLLIFMATARRHPRRGGKYSDATESQAVSSNDNPPVIVEVSGIGDAPWWLRRIAWSVYHQSRWWRKCPAVSRPTRKRSF
ncbi:hypothetical protein ACLB1O_14855 [Escherichia coli]